MHFPRLQNAFGPAPVFSESTHGHVVQEGAAIVTPTDPQRASLPGISSMNIRLEAEWFPR